MKETDMEILALCGADTATVKAPQILATFRAASNEGQQVCEEDNREQGTRVIRYV